MNGQGQLAQRALAPGLHLTHKGCCKTHHGNPAYKHLHNRELSTFRQMMKVPNEPGLSPNNGLRSAFLSDQSMASNKEHILTHIEQQ